MCNEVYSRVERFCGLSGRNIYETVNRINYPRTISKVSVRRRTCWPQKRERDSKLFARQFERAKRNFVSTNAQRSYEVFQWKGGRRGERVGRTVWFYFRRGFLAFALPFNRQNCNFSIFPAQFRSPKPLKCTLKELDNYIHSVELC